MDFITLSRQLEAWETRRRKAAVFLWAPRGLLAGLSAAAIVATIGRFRPLLTNEELTLVSLVLALSGIIVCSALVYFHRHSLLETARFADRHFGLQERASTAVEIHDGRLPTASDFARQQLDDAVQAAAQVDEEAGLPYSLARRDIALILIALFLLMAAVLLPNPQSVTLLQKRAFQGAVEEQVQALESLAASIEQEPALSEAQRQELLAPIQGALAELQEGDLSREQVVAVLSEAEADLRQLGEADDGASLRNALAGAGQPLAESAAGQPLGESLQNGDLAGAGPAANRLADTLPVVSPEDQAELARQLSQAAAALQETDPELAAEFADAAQALREGDLSAAQQALREAAATLQQRAGEQAQAQLAESAAGQLNQSREAVAQAGESGQSGASPDQNQGQGSGQEGQDPGPSPGQGQGTGQGQGAGQAQGSGLEEGNGPAGPGPGGGHVDNVYVPDFVDLSGEPGVELELPAECLANPERCGGLLSETATEFGDEQSLVPYDQVFGDYRDAAYQALEADLVPLNLKNFVRDYFSSLEP